MEATARFPVRLPRVGSLRLDPASLGAWLLPFALIIYLALNNGGYDVIERSEAGMVVWWMVLVGTVVGGLPAAGGTRAGRVMLVVLTAFAAWTALSLIWTESAGRTSIELGRVAAYLGFFALSLAVQGEGRWRQLLNGAAAALAVVAGIAVLSRLEPTWFPRQLAGHFYAPEVQIQGRLAYPLNYSSGLGALTAMAVPLLLAATYLCRTVAAQALAAAAFPVVALALWLTASGLSVPVAALGLLVFFLLAPDRLPKLLTLLIAGAGSAVLFAAVNQRASLDHGLTTPLAQHQGDELLVILIVVCAGIGLVQVGLSLAVRYGTRPRWLLIPKRQAAWALGVLATMLLVGALVTGVPGQLSDKWHQFKRFDTSAAGKSRGNQILDFSGNGRYQFWEAAADANATEPWKGIGPGTFEFWWARNGSYGGFVRDAHSLYMDTLAELGIIGFVLIVGLVGGVVVIGSVRSLRAPPDLRLGLAAATAGAAVFAAGAGLDWLWELGVLPVIFLMLAALAVAGGSSKSAPVRPEAATGAGRGASLQRLAPRVAVVIVTGLALVAIAIPLAGASELSKSQHSAGKGQLGSALSEAQVAQSVQPYAATPRIQEALVLELEGRLRAALSAARAATRDEPTNWRNWLVLSRLAARAGNAETSVKAYREARALHPHSPIFGA